MDNSGNLALLALVVGTALVGLVWYFFDPNIPWWGFLILWVIATGWTFKGLARDVANAKTVDRG